MSNPERERAKTMLRDLAAGELPLRDVAVLSAQEIRSIEKIAIDAFQKKSFATAIGLFGFLRRLEPDKPIHIFHQAHAFLGNNDEAGAVRALSQYLQRQKTESPDNIARALLLRAKLTERSHPEQAQQDVSRAQSLRANPVVASLLRDFSRNS